MSSALVANVVIAGVLTGLVYGLMALGLSVIFGVVRVVNFAHGEMMTVAMYAATVLFAALKLDPFLAILPVSAAFFVFGYALQSAVINPFVTRPEHAQFMLLIAADAFKRARSTDPEALTDAIRQTNITEKMTLGGPIRFNSKGQVEGIGSASVQNLDGLPRVVLPKPSAEAKPVFPAPYYKT